MPFDFNDAQAALGFVTSQTSHIETEVLKKPYPEIKYAQQIPVDTSANPFAASVTFFTQDSVGAAKFINGNGDDIPLVGLNATKFEQTVNMAGIGYQFTIEEIGQAQMLGMNLSSDGADTARQAYELLVDSTAMLGNTQLGVQGLSNMTGITSVAAAATFALSTADAILGYINAALVAIFTNTKGTAMGNTIILPLAQYADIATRRLDPTMTTTILEHIQRSNIYTIQTGLPLTIMADHRISKMIIYKRDPKVLKLHMPMPLRFLPPQLINLSIRVPGMFRFAPLSIRQPLAVRYVTGI